MVFSTVLRGARRAASLFWVAWLCSACGREAFDGHTYRDENVQFRLGALPDNFERVRSTESLLAFQDREAGATIAISARCGLDGDDIPLGALVQHLFIQLTDRKTEREERFQLDGRDALESEVSAKLDGVERRFLVVVLKKDGCVYDQVYVDRGGDEAELVRSRDAFRAMARGFRAL